MILQQLWITMDGSQLVAKYGKNASDTIVIRLDFQEDYFFYSSYN